MILIKMSDKDLVISRLAKYFNQARWRLSTSTQIKMIARIFVITGDPLTLTYVPHHKSLIMGLNVSEE